MTKAQSGRLGGLRNIGEYNPACNCGSWHKAGG